MSIEIGTEGEVISGARCGLPDHIDGVPLPRSVPMLRLPRRYLSPLPMFELREDGDGGGSVAARWPEPFDDHRLADTAPAAPEAPGGVS